jgi:alpha-galactosidase
MLIAGRRHILHTLCFALSLSLFGCGGDVDSAKSKTPGATTSSPSPLAGGNTPSAGGGTTTSAGGVTTPSAGGGTTSPTGPGTTTSAGGVTTPSAAATANNSTTPTVMQVAVRPPPMGWSSWNSLQEQVNYTAIQAEANGMVALNAQIPSGNKFQYVNIDEGWWTSTQRDASGNFIINNTQWPGGMQAMAQYIHSKGLKAGIYIDAGPQGCGTLATGPNGHFLGSDPSHYNSDFLQFAQWGFDYVKVDFCGGSAAGYDPQVVYTEIDNAIQSAYAQTGQLLTFSMCDWGTVPTTTTFPDYDEGPWVWGPGIATLWRTTGDIYTPNSGAPPFGNVTSNLAGNYHPTSQHTGYYNDPDMMVAGMGMSAANDLAHVSLWAAAGAPMILGNDLSKPLSSTTTTLLTNPAVIAIDQDPLGLQGIKVAQSGLLQVWSKLLSGTGQRAVVLFNNSTADAPMTVSWQELGLTAASATVSDVWAGKSLGSFATSYTAPDVPAGSVVMLTISGTDTPTTTYTSGTLSAGATSVACSSCVSGQTVTKLGAVTFNNILSSTTGGYLEIGYVNSGSQTLKASLSVNSGQATTVAFPPVGTAGAIGTVTVYVPFQSGTNTATLTSLNSTTPAPGIDFVGTVAGPVALQPLQIAYEADAPGNKETGIAAVAPCSACTDGEYVGWLGEGSTFTMNGISVPTAGTYTFQIGYVNGDPTPRTAQISFNGATPITVTFPPSGSWTTTSSISVTGTFSAGSSNSLQFGNPTGYSANIYGITAPVLQP